MTEISTATTRQEAAEPHLNESAPGRVLTLHTKEPAENTGQGLLNAMRDIGIELRYNTRAGRVEIRDLVAHPNPYRPSFSHMDAWRSIEDIGETPTLELTAKLVSPAPEWWGWEQLTERKTADLRELLSERWRWGSSTGKLTRALWSELFLVAEYRTETDPFQEWLERISPKWDGQPRLDRLFVAAFGAEDTPLVRHAATSLMVGAVRRTYEPGCKHDETVVVIGRQGTGKSTFGRAFGTPPQPR